MFSRKTVFSAIVALAMMALPLSALAGHDHDSDDDQRPNAWHDHGWHKGWYKHHEHGDDDERESGDEHHHHRAPMYATPRDYRDFDPHGHHKLCDEDRDDCHVVNQHYWGGYDYGPPVSYYESMPPSSYNLAQQRNWLIQRRQRAYYVLAKMRARGDRNAANRMLKVADRLNAQIASDNQLITRGRYAPPAGVPYPGDTYGTGYNPNYGTDPTVNAIGGIVGPLLGQPPH